MIGKLKGTIEHLYEDNLIIDTGGVGYVVYCTSRTLLAANVGHSVSLFIQMIVKEDQISLYGFDSEVEKKSFNFLQTVQGVGAKVALSILSHLSSSDIYAAVMVQDVSCFRQVSGIGPKLAERIVNELKSSKSLSYLSGFDVPFSSSNPLDPKKDGTPRPVSSTADAISALVALGYSKKDAFVVVQSVTANDESLGTEEIIKHSLKKLSGI